VKKFIKKIALPVTVMLLYSHSVMAATTDLSLEDSIALTLQNNSDMKVAQLEKEKAQWSLTQAKAKNGLAVNFQHSETRSTAPPSGSQDPLDPLAPYNYFANQLTATLPLYTSGKIEGYIDQAKLNTKLSDSTITATKDQLKLEATTDYYSVLQAQKLLQVAQQGVDDFNSHLNTVQDQYNAGLVSTIDILRTKVQLANSQDNLVKAQNNYSLAVYNLNNIMGLPLHSETTLKENLAYIPYAKSLDESIQYALANRPEVAQAATSIAIAQDQVQISKSDLHPTISLVGTKAWDDMSFPGSQYSNWTASVVAQINVFDSGATNAQIKQAKDQLQITQEKTRKLNDDISLQVNAAYLNMKESEKRIDTNKVAVDQAQESFRLEELRYRNGMNTNLDVLDSELQLIQTKTNYIQALYAYSINKATLEKAIGL
jgi:outer membrane protein TolC